MKKSARIKAAWFPEVGVGGFTSIDGTIEFYTRINALLEPTMTVLNFGAGRGVSLIESESEYKKELMTLKGKVKKVIACDVDKTVLHNPGADETMVTQPDEPLPFANNTFDIIISDFVFEHIANPALMSAELQRILRPGGWICARTPNKYCLISILTRLTRNSQHVSLLRRVQPERKSIDTFPTVFRFNSMRDIKNWFGLEIFENFTYRYEAEPSYFFNSRFVFTLMLLINRFIPSLMKSGLFVFLRKKEPV